MVHFWQFLNNLLNKPSKLQFQRAQTEHVCCVLVGYDDAGMDCTLSNQKSDLHKCLIEVSIPKPDFVEYQLNLLIMGAGDVAERKTINNVWFDWMNATISVITNSQSLTVRVTYKENYFGQTSSVKVVDIESRDILHESGMKEFVHLFTFRGNSNKITKNVSPNHDDI